MAKRAPVAPADAPVEMPAFSAELASLRAFYRLEFAPDGTVCRRNDDGTLEPWHMYGAYVLLDYTSQYAANPSEQLRDAIARVAATSLAGASDFRGRLVFWHAAGRTARQPERHYSALTQAYYALALQRAADITGDQSLRTAACEVANAIFISARRGGVLYRWGDEVAPALVPTAPRDLVLNGWLSTLCSMSEYAELAGSRRIKRLVAQSTGTLRKLLPLYDVPALANSRYGLTGPVYLRLKFGAPIDGVRVGKLRLNIANEGNFRFASEPGTRWSNYLTHPDEDVTLLGPDRIELRRSALRLNAVLSRHSYPAPNRVTFTIKTPRPMPVALLVNVGDYDPLANNMANREWREGDQAVLPAGTHEVTLNLAWEVTDLVVYPTNFIKRIGERPTNSYHMVHIARLRELAALSGEDGLLEWAERWARYVATWSTDKRYAGLYVRDTEAVGEASITPRKFAQRQRQRQR